MVDPIDIAGKVRGRQSAVLFTGPGLSHPTAWSFLRAISPAIEVNIEVTSYHVLAYVTRSSERIGGIHMHVTSLIFASIL